MQNEPDHLLSSVDPLKQRQVCIAISRYVIEYTGVKDNEVLSILAQAEKGDGDYDLAKLDLVSRQTEEPYLASQEKGVTDAHLKEFYQARAIDTLKYALTGDFSRSIYEAYHATDANIELTKHFLQEALASF